VYHVKPVTNKLDGMRRWHAGEFGNKLRTWPYVEYFRRNICCPEAGLRYSDPRGGGACFEAHIPHYAVHDRIVAWEFMGRNLDNIMVCEEAPDHRLVVNGEYHDVYGFHFSRVKKPMRAALKEGGRCASVPRARLMLRQAMTPSSWTDFEELTETYPEHVIELSVYECMLGVLPGRNTIIWEVRNY